MFGNDFSHQICELKLDRSYILNIKIASEYSRFPIIDVLKNASIDTSLFSTQAKSGSWNLSSGLIFKYSVIEDQIDERSIEQLLYDLESEFLMVFGPSANLRKQKPSYLQNRS